jgi:4-carboxymuconolactone decarboxylase
MKNDKSYRIRLLTETELLALISSASVVRDEKLFRSLIKIYLKNNMDDNVLYEAILQTYLFAGFPSALISLKVLSEYVPAQKTKSDLRTNKKIKYDGEQNCKKIYGEKFEKLISNVSSFSSELSEWLIIEGYGKVLGRKFIPLKTRELLIVSMLTSLKYDEQLFSHIRGALKLGNKFNSIHKILSNLELINQKDALSFGIKVLAKFQS